MAARSGWISVATTLNPVAITGPVPVQIQDRATLGTGFWVHPVEHGAADRKCAALRAVASSGSTVGGNTLGPRPQSAATAVGRARGLLRVHKTFFPPNPRMRWDHDYSIGGVVLRRRHSHRMRDLFRDLGLRRQGKLLRSDPGAAAYQSAGLAERCKLGVAGKDRWDGLTACRATPRGASPFGESLEDASPERSGDGHRDLTERRRWANRKSLGLRAARAT